MLTTKHATIEDINVIFKWRNDNLSRRFSFNTKPINKKDHSEWFKSCLNSKNNYYYICYFRKKKIAFVKYELNKKNRYFVSINLNPSFRNKGLAAKVLIDTQLQKEIKKIDIVFAKIKKNNLRSLSSFKNAGYVIYRKYANYYLFRKTSKRDNLIDMKKGSYKKYELIISKIEKIRSKNNTNWMDILKIAFKNDPKAAAKVMSQIYKDDQKISKLAKKLGE